jgi:hypothetical protein
MLLVKIYLILTVSISVLVILLFLTSAVLKMRQSK